MDIKTLAVTLVLVLATLSLLAGLVAKGRRDAALKVWAWGLVCSAIGFLVFFAQGLVPVAGFLLVGNVLLISYNLSLPWGLRLFLGMTVHWPRRYTVYFVLWAAIMVLLTVLYPQYTWRASTSSLYMALLTIEFGLLVLGAGGQIPRRLKVVLGTTSAVYAGFHLYRAVAVHLGSAGSLLDDPTMTATMFFLSLAAAVLWAGGLILLDSERLQRTVRNDSVELRRLNLLKDRVLAMTGHDLRGPLGNLRLIWGELGIRIREGRSLDLDPELLDLVDLSLSGTQDLLENLFSFAEAQKSGGDPKARAVLSVAVSGALDLWTAAALTKGVSLVPGGGDVPLVRADQDAVAAVLRNLVGNAVKFTPPGGSVTVSVGSESPDIAFLEVQDTGVGMDAEALTRTTGLAGKNTRPGTSGERGSGFGLVLVRELVEGWGGTLAFESAPGRGTKVRITFSV